MVNPLELTYYANTGYNFSDEPADDAAIDLNAHWAAPLTLKDYDPANLQTLAVYLSDDELKIIDYLKIRDTFTNERWYYFVAGHQRRNERTVVLKLVLDSFATVGLSNISFFGNIARRSLSESEAVNYPLLPEPWAPRRPLKTRRVIIDLNVNKSIKVPSHISPSFEESVTEIENEQVIKVPNSPIGITSFTDSLSIDVDLPVGYPNPAADTTHTVKTPWGSVSYTTPYEQYLTLSGGELLTFLAKAKKFNALDLIEPPYYVPAPAMSQNITLTELANPNTKNLKASKYYTTITIRSLASNSAQTYADSNANLQYNQELTVIVAPDKHGGIYVLPRTIRDTGLNAYTYLDGVYSPFESVVYNAAGDTPAKYAADGTTLLNTALNNLFQVYINKVNALQVEGMQAKYFKDVGTLKGLVMSFVSDLLASESTTTTTTASYYQNSTTTTNTPYVTQTSRQEQTVPTVTQRQSQNTTTPSYTSNQNSTTHMPVVTSTQNSNMNSPAYNQVQCSYSYTPNSSTGAINMPAVTTNIAQHYQTTATSTNQAAYNFTSNVSTQMPQIAQHTDGDVTIVGHTVNSVTNTTTPAYSQTSDQRTHIPAQTTTSHTTQEASSRSVEQGNDIAVQGIPTVFEIGDYAENAWGVLKTAIFGGYRNEIHSFMLGNINDYLNRWISIQNDMHNGKVANLFKNITLVGNYTDYNKLVGKYEILIASLQPEDEQNFDLFLQHFGHAVDEYTDVLVSDVNPNYNYTMVGEDAMLANSISQESSARILNQFRTGVRVWKTLIRPENY